MFCTAASVPFHQVHSAACHDYYWCPVLSVPGPTTTEVCVLNRVILELGELLAAWLHLDG